MGETSDFLTKGILLGLVHPLYDIVTTVDSTLLERYCLKPNNAIVADTSHISLLGHILRSKTSYSPGGSTQNTLRVAQWYLKQRGAVVSVGCVGKDGHEMMEYLDREGLQCLYQIEENMLTGLCAVLLTPPSNRSLITWHNAARKYNTKHLLLPAVTDAINLAKFFYVSCFLLNGCPDCMVILGKHAAQQNKCFIMNLGAPFLSDVFYDSLQSVLPYCDIVFGNEDEAQAFAKNFELDTTDLHDIAQKVAALPKKNTQRSRIVIFTQGAEPTVVFKDGKVKEYPVIPIAAKDIVDTNGAGDAFVGGFLAEYVQGADIDKCVQNGSRAAHMIIQVSGCTLSEEKSS